MYFTPTIFMAQLLAVMQVLMTLNMPLRTTMALPVTSKPIESTVENLAWQAWIELPPEQKQQVKSRKVTPKSIFTLPNRIECPEGHKQVDTKCIPIVIGTNANLIAANYLTIIAGNSPTDEQYDYDDVEEVQFSFNPEMQIGEAEKSVDGLTVELKPPSKDEPLKFNIFENKFNIYHEEPFEDYLSSLSNEANSGVSSSFEKESSLTVANKSSNSSANITAINDFVSARSNVSESNIEVGKTAESITTQLSTDLAESNTMTTLSSDSTDFKVNAISLPASGFELQKPHKLSMLQNDPTIQMITTVMDTEAENQNEKEQQRQQQQEHDIQTLLQTDSLLPLNHPPTATTLLSSALPESSSLTAVTTGDLNVSSSNSFILNIEDIEEMATTPPNIMDQEMETKGDKIEYTRSVTFNPLISDDAANTDIVQDDVNETTLKSIMNDEPLETTTPIQLDDTTIMENIETSTLLFALSAADAVDLSTQQDLKELLIKQEQAIKDFEELQRKRKGHKDQHTVLKKSKVEPVEVLSTTTATTDMPTTTTMDELITAETVTPLLTVHNENDNNNNNNDRFYYQHFAKQDLEETLPIAATKQRTSEEFTTLATATVTKTTDIEAMPATKTSEIDLAEELRLINELVKGITPAKTTTNLKTKIPTKTTTAETITPLTDVRSSSSSPAPNLSESSAATIKPTLSTSQIWSKIMPLLTRTQQPESLLSTSSTIEETSKSSTESSATASNRSNRNSKIIRINGFNSFSSMNPLSSSTTTTSTTTTTTTTEEPSPSTTTISPTAESYWWLPVAWRLDKPAATEQQQQQHDTTEVKQEEQPLLLRFWSAYHAPKSS